MNLGSSAADLGLTIVLLVPALLVPMLLLGVSALIGRVFRLGAVVTLALVLLLCGGALLGASLALDSAGRVVPAVVIEHAESVRVRTQGDWRHRMTVAVRYNLDGSTPTAGAGSADESSAPLRLAPQSFDQLREGATADLRVLPVVRSLALVRLASTSTRDAVPWGLVALFGGGALALIVGRWLFRSTVGGIIAIVAVLLAGVGTPLALAYQRSASSDDGAARPLRATAQISDVTPITEVDPFPCRAGSGSNCARRASRYAVAQPYAIVQMRFVPQGAAGAVIAVDAVDASNAPAYAPGATVEIAYAFGDARRAVIVGATHRHYWRNALGFALLFGGFAAGLTAFLVWVVRRARPSRRRRAVAVTTVVLFLLAAPHAAARTPSIDLLPTSVSHERTT